MYEFYLNSLFSTLPFFFKGWAVTLQLSAICLVISTVAGFLLGILTYLRIPVLKHFIAGYVDIIRGTPFLVQIFIIFFILPEWGIDLDAFASAVIALSIYGTSYICAIVHAGLETVPLGQAEAAMASGLSLKQSIRYVVFPQAIRPVLPPLVGQYVLMIKDTAIVSVIGLTDITRVGWLTVQRIPDGILVFGLVGVFYFVTCYPLLFLANHLEKKLTIQNTKL
ncbi:MAG: amino acid ABC transporter permease [Desulfotalea sp.]